jgi:hypothetical protein
MAEEKKVEAKAVKVVVVNSFGLAIVGKHKVMKRGDVVELNADLAKRLGGYDGCLPRDIKVKPFDKVTKEELAELNKVETAPNKGNPTGKNK